MNELINLLSKVIRFYSIVVLVNVILSWFVYNTQNMIVRRIYWTTGQFVDPALAPIRKLLSPVTKNFGGIDISPIILIFLLQVLRRILIGAL